ILPPFPAYLDVAYPELVVSFVFLAGLAWLMAPPARVPPLAHAAIAGALFAVGALARETSLVALPVYFVRLERRAFWRAFVPATLLTLVVVVAPLSKGRAIHPNAI